MTETSQSMDAATAEAETDATNGAEPIPDVAGSSVETASSADRKIRDCPKCHARYAKAASECVTCSVALVDEQPRDIALFRPELDVPFVIAFALYVFGHDKLNGEAQSFGLIFLIVGFATLVTFRAISYAEWLGRR